MRRKKILSLFILTMLSIQAYSQLIGIGGQYSQRSNGQFFVSAALPTCYKVNALRLMNFSGIEYITPGKARLSGIQLKPIQLSSYLSDKIFYDSPIVITLGIDAGYLFNFSKGYKNTIILTPNFYLDYKIFFLKTGYEIDTFHGNHQFFIRAGIGFVLGTMKNFKLR